MSDADWDDTAEAFAAALDLDGETREAFLATLRERHPARAETVARLLRADAEPHDLFSDTGRADALGDGLRHLANRPPTSADSLRERTEADLAGRYSLGEVLGEGGMAVVFAAEEAKHARRVALKVMRPEVAGRVDPRRFHVEVQLTAQLAHPHVVPLYDSGEAGGLPYYAMALVDGETLTARIAREGPLPLTDVREVVRGVARALDHAHARHILHRDVKPGNVLLHGQHAWLADFGIGKTLAEEDVSLTRVGAMLGTLRYMAPEALRGESVGPSADLYSLALVAYEALVGRPAFEGTTPYALAESRGLGVTPPTRVRPSLPVTTDALFRRALAEVPDARFESAVAFADALDSALSGTPTPPASVLDAGTLAVLPFEGDGEDALLGEGIAEQLTVRLGTSGGLRVAARASAAAAIATTGGPREAARLLGATRVVTGRVRRSGDRLRVTAELVEAATGLAAWSARYDREAADVFEVEDAIARALADALHARLSPDRPTAVPDLRAYEHYLRARHGVFSFTADGLSTALRDLHRALDILPENVTLLAALGYVHWQHVNAGIEPDPAHLDRAMEMADRIAEIQPGSHHADRLRGLAAIHQGRPEDAIVHLEATLTADPRDTDAAFWLALLLGFRGQPHRVEPHVRMLVETDPLNPLHQMLPGFLALMRGHTKAAPEFFRRALNMAPENPVLRLGCGQAEAMAGEHEAARATLASLDAAPGLFSGLARGLRRGMGETLDPLTEAETEAASADIQWCWTAAQGHALAGEPDEAVAWMERAVAVGFVNYPLAALYDPLLAPLRGHAAYDALLRQIEAAWSASVMPQAR